MTQSLAYSQSHSKPRTKSVNEGPHQLSDSGEKKSTKIKSHSLLLAYLSKLPTPFPSPNYTLTYHSKGKLKRLYMLFIYTCSCMYLLIGGKLE